MASRRRIDRVNARKFGVNLALAFYKPGQGYWTRALTAVGAGVLVLAGAAWIWGAIPGRLGTFLRKSPESVGRLRAAYEPSGQDAMKLMVEPTAATHIQDLAERGRIKSLMIVGGDEDRERTYWKAIEPETGYLYWDEDDRSNGLAIGSADAVANTFIVSGDLEAEFASGRTFNVNNSTSNNGRYTSTGSAYTLSPNQTTINVSNVPATEVSDTIVLDHPLYVSYPAGSVLKVDTGEDYVLYVQAGVGVSLIMASAIVMYWLLNSPRIVDFMIATEAEMRKVNWPTKQEIYGSTIVVITGTIMLALLLFIADLAFGWVFRAVGILEGG